MKMFICIGNSCSSTIDRNINRFNHARNQIIEHLQVKEKKKPIQVKIFKLALNAARNV